MERIRVLQIGGPSPPRGARGNGGFAGGLLALLKGLLFIAAGILFCAGGFVLVLVYFAVVFLMRLFGAARPGPIATPRRHPAAAEPEVVAEATSAREEEIWAKAEEKAARREE